MVVYLVVIYLIVCPVCLSVSLVDMRAEKGNEICGNKLAQNRGVIIHNQYFNVYEKSFSI